MIHRALMGSLERFFGVLIEHYAGAFPTWLAPVQAKLIPIGEDQHEYANALFEQLREANIRVEVDDRNEKLGFKIRDAQVHKVPYMLVIGGKEVEAKTVAVRTRAGGDEGTMPIDAFVARITEEIRERTL